MHPSGLTHHERLSLCATHVTLEGRRAIIMGFQSEKATVLSLDGCYRVELSWETVKAIVAKGGRFEV